MLTINELSKTIGTYLQPEQVDKIQLAYQFSAEAHEGQKRKSGEPYIYHPLEVAYILGDMRMDYQTLVAVGQTVKGGETIISNPKNITKLIKTIIK